MVQKQQQVINRNILFVLNSKAITGAFQSALNIASHSEGTNFVFCIPKNSTIKKELKKRNYIHYELPFIEIGFHWKTLFYLHFLFFNTTKIKKIVYKENIDIIHVNDIYNMIGVVHKIFNKKIPVVYHVRLMRNSYIKKMYGVFASLIKRYADRIICVSHAIKQDLKINFSEVIYDYLPSKEFKLKGDNTSGSNIGQNKMQILYLANFTRGKGQQYAVEALHLLVHTHGLSHCSMKMIGGDFNIPTNQQFRNEIKELIKQKELSDHVEMTGFIENTEEAYHEADIFLNCSESESFSFTTLEALQTGTPVVVTDSGGPRELFESGKSGFLVSNKNVTEIANALAQLISSPELQKKFALEGRKYVEEKFNLPNTIGKIDVLYQEITS